MIVYKSISLPILALPRSTPLQVALWAMSRISEISWAVPFRPQEYYVEKDVKRRQNHHASDAFSHRVLSCLTANCTIAKWRMRCRSRIDDADDTQINRYFDKSINTVAAGHMCKNKCICRQSRFETLYVVATK